MLCNFRSIGHHSYPSFGQSGPVLFHCDGDYIGCDNTIAECSVYMYVYRCVQADFILSECYGLFAWVGTSPAVDKLLDH